MEQGHVTVIEILKDEETGRINLGNTVELPIEEAKAAILAGKVKHPDYPLQPDTKIGGYPPEWDATESKAVEVAAEEDHDVGHLV